MFIQRENRNIFQAAGSMLVLIHHQTVYNLRTSSRNAVTGLLMTVLQSCLMILGFLAFYLLIGVKSSPIRGDFMLFLMSGIFPYFTHIRAVMAVASSYSVSGNLVKHEPLNSVILVSAAALSMLYNQTISALVLVAAYHMIINPIEFDYWPGVLAMFLLSWFSGVCIGLLFLGVSPWAPKAVGIIMPLYVRFMMIASGKMFVANMIPPSFLNWIDWNPLFHAIDQLRGFLFINYTPHNSNPLQPIWFSLGVLVLGMLINFTTRKYESLSWGAGN